MTEKETCPVCDLHVSRLYYEGYCPNAFDEDGRGRTAEEHLAARDALTKAFGPESTPPLTEEQAKGAIAEYEDRYHKHGLHRDEVST